MKSREVFDSHGGRQIVKWAHYFPAYDRHFQKFVGRPVKFMEIGAGHGGSAQMWARYFGPLATIVSIDIRERARAFAEGQVQVRIGDQSDLNFLRSLVEEFGAFDCILDDGSHVMQHVIASFNFLYPRMAEDGVYMVEDLHTAYRPGYGGGLRHEGSFIEICKSLIDQLNAQHVRDASFQRTEFSDTTVSMHFYDSIAVFERGRTQQVQKVAVGGDEQDRARMLERFRRRHRRPDDAERRNDRLTDIGPSKAVPRPSP